MEDLKDFLGIKGLYRYGTNINTYDVAKFLAIFFMIIDHLGYFFFRETYELRGLGRIAFPIFFFLIGYSNYLKPSWNLLFIGATITIFRGLMKDTWMPFDILVTAFFVRIALDYLVKKNLLHGYDLIGILFSLIILHIASLLVISYGTLGMMFAICGYLKRQENDGTPQKNLGYIILFTVFCDYLLQNLTFDKAAEIREIFSVVSFGLLYFFVNFRVIEYAALKNKLLNNVILFLGRNSLFIYWLHFIAFIYISTKLLAQ